MTFKGHESRINSAIYSLDGKQIVTASADGIVQIYTTDMETLLQIAGSQVTCQPPAEDKETYGVLNLD